MSDEREHKSNVIKREDIVVSDKPKIIGHSRNAAPVINVVKNNQKITGIQVTCTCGKLIEIECE